MEKKLILVVMLITSNFMMGCQNKNQPITDKNLQAQTEILNSEKHNQINVGKFLQFYNSIKKLDRYNFSYESLERKRFKRYPGLRKGIQIIDLNIQQRIQLNDILNDILSSQGYLKLLGIISNEDIKSRAEEDVGREKYWVTFFGVPDEENRWGFRLEGHHASLNFSFSGSEISSTTPFILGADPSVLQNGKYTPFTEKDNYREGYNILYEEEDIALELIHLLKEGSHENAFIELKSNMDLLTENNEILDMQSLKKNAKISNGISITDLNKPETKKLINLVNVYFSNFKEKTVNETYLIKKNTQFIFAGNFQKNEKFYYRITNDDFVIEFQNIGNHIHFIFRSFINDFGKISD